MKAHSNIEAQRVNDGTKPAISFNNVLPAAASTKDVLQKAQKANNDEFYTRYEDVEKELPMYDKRIWNNKVVFCNCDDAVGEDEKNTSAFALYFIKNFKQLGLKKLICTHYGGTIDLFNAGAKGYVFTKTGFKEIKESPKNYTGSFDDPLSLKILKDEADIVCTNPPFSRATDFWKIIIKSGKKFLILSNITNPITASFIPYFYNNKVWAGFNEVDWFLTPRKELTRAAGHWYTNFNVRNRPKYAQLKIVPLKEIPEKYKKVDDSKTLVVDNNYIPNDYKKPFAVSARPILNGVLEKGYSLIDDNEYYPYINDEKKFARVLIKKVEAAVFQPGVVETVKKHIDKKGMPLFKEGCPLREAIYVSNKHSQKSSRATYCCKARTGLFLSDWRCVGLSDNRCVFKVASDYR